MKKLSQHFLIVALTLGLYSCGYKAAFDENKEIDKKEWRYVNRVKFKVTISDHTVKYNVIFNLRHTNNYRYSNIFVLVHQIDPQGKRKTERQEFTLAYPDGQWIGDGSSIINYRCIFKENYQFPKNGTYWFEVEQNMRDNPLKEISDVGLTLVRSDDFKQ